MLVVVFKVVDYDQSYYPDIRLFFRITEKLFTGTLKPAAAANIQGLKIKSGNVSEKRIQEQNQNLRDSQVRTGESR